MPLDPDAPPALPAPAEIYQQLWEAGEQAIRSGACQGDPPPGEGDPRWGLSVVIPIEGAVRERLAAELAALSAVSDSHHLHYRPECLHSTVRSVEGYQEDIPPDQVDRYARQLADAVGQLPPLRLTLHGLGCSPGGVFACGYPSHALHLLRHRLHRAAEADRPPAATSVDRNRMRNTAHVSLLVFRDPVAPAPGLADYLAGRRRHSYGTLEVEALTLVRYRWRDGGVDLEELHRIRLPA